ncbi:centromere/kinetochore protein zw10 homolog isoform X2 [Patiria miniata]|uniref:Centromere/kinetochore protein zw10 homolog n=1 Tax=Patiria miniata TaxID=46514 RepID=A0A914BFR4_PATMI|nr:centromere/kinetochore protein zw10 homolog isoform X2 [Patiria miniata]
MASLVTDVLLANTDLLEKEDLGTRIGKLSTHIDEIKGEIYHAVHEKYANYRPTRDSTQELHNKVQTLSTEMQTLSNKIKGDISSQLNSSTSDLHDLTRQLEKTNAIIDVLQSLCKVNDLLTDFQSFVQNGEFLQAANAVNELKSDLDVLIEDGYCELKIVKALRSELRVNQETLLHHLGEAWSAMTVWTIPRAKEPVTLTNVSQVQLKVVNIENAAVTVNAMKQVGILKSKMQVFGKKLMEYILKPVVTLSNVAPSINAAKKSQSTTVGFKVLPKSSEEPSDPVAVYKSTLAILKALSGPLLSLKTEGKNGDENTTLMAMLGEHVWPELSKCIITHCLVHSIPTSSSKLNEYKAVITATEGFEASLRKTGFIAETASPLLTYARDVNVHFANKKCQELIVEARKLMKRELHNTKRVGTMKVDNKDVKDQKQDTKDKCHVSEGIFALPECAVSDSIECLVNLAYQTLQEAASNTPQCAIQLFYTVRNMFEIFCDVVPTYHRDSLKLPQVCALHHNNCMYIAHHLLTLGHQYRQSLPPPLCDGTSTFVNLIPVFRKLASECFLAQMVVHQLGHLQRVWTDILPSNIYTKAMSTLINTVLMHILEKVSSFEDISADDAQQLHSLLSGLQDRIPHLIKPGEVEEPVLVQSTVDQWTSFSELLFMLDASMQDIVDRWAEGKGPLAMVFSASDVKSLIRAIFQNTDRRATALAKIR